MSAVVERGINGSVSNGAVAELLALFARVVRPPKKVDPIQWLERHRNLSPEASAEPGAFHFDRIPYAVEPQRAILDPGVPEVCLCWASQCAKTEIATLNPLLFWSVTAPAPALVVTPDWKSAHSLSCDRIDPMLRDSRVPGIELEEETSGGPGSDNSLFRKTIGHGMPLTIVNALSASGLAMRPFVEWGSIFEEWRAAIELKRQGDWSLYRSVCGCRLAEAMKRPAETLAGLSAKLMARREVYAEKLPDQIKVVVAAVDTQDSWLEFLILAFGERRECWALETG